LGQLAVDTSAQYLACCWYSWSNGSWCYGWFITAWIWKFIRGAKEI